jgi:NADPH:quinone reductase-like Zn-dependent oxidoreductase
LAASPTGRFEGRPVSWVALLTSGDETRRKAAVEYITKGLEAGALRPVIDRTFMFGEMVKAYRHLEQNGQFGKIVVTVRRGSLAFSNPRGLRPMRTPFRPAALRT